MQGLFRSIGVGLQPPAPAGMPSLPPVPPGSEEASYCAPPAAGAAGAAGAESGGGDGHDGGVSAEAAVSLASKAMRRSKMLEKKMERYRASLAAALLTLHATNRVLTQVTGQTLADFMLPVDADGMLSPAPTENGGATAAAGVASSLKAAFMETTKSLFNAAAAGPDALAAPGIPSTASVSVLAAGSTSVVLGAGLPPTTSSSSSSNRAVGAGSGSATPVPATLGNAGSMSSAALLSASGGGATGVSGGDGEGAATRAARGSVQSVSATPMPAADGSATPLAVPNPPYEGYVLDEAALVERLKTLGQAARGEATPLVLSLPPNVLAAGSSAGQGALASGTATPTPPQPGALGTASSMISGGTFTSTSAASPDATAAVKASHAVQIQRLLTEMRLNEQRAAEEADALRARIAQQQSAVDTARAAEAATTAHLATVSAQVSALEAELVQVRADLSRASIRIAELSAVPQTAAQHSAEERAALSAALQEARAAVVRAEEEARDARAAAAAATMRAAHVEREAAARATAAAAEASAPAVGGLTPEALATQAEEVAGLREEVRRLGAEMAARTSRSLTAMADKDAEVASLRQQLNDRRRSSMGGERHAHALRTGSGHSIGFSVPAHPPAGGTPPLAAAPHAHAGVPSPHVLSDSMVEGVDDTAEQLMLARQQESVLKATIREYETEIASLRACTNGLNAEFLRNIMVQFMVFSAKPATAPQAAPLARVIASLLHFSSDDCKRVGILSGGHAGLSPTSPAMRSPFSPSVGSTLAGLGHGSGGVSAGMGASASIERRTGVSGGGLPADRAHRATASSFASPAQASGAQLFSTPPQRGSMEWGMPATFGSPYLEPRAAAPSSAGGSAGAGAGAGISFSSPRRIANVDGLDAAA